MNGEQILVFSDGRYSVQKRDMSTRSAIQPRRPSRPTAKDSIEPLGVATILDIEVRIVNDPNPTTAPW